MDRHAMDRVGAACGLGFVLLGLVAGFLSGDTGDTHRELLAYYADEGNRTENIVQAALFALAALGLIVFSAALGGRLVRAAGAPGGAGALVIGAGAAAGTLMIAAAATWVSIPAALGSDEFRLDPNTADLLGNLGYALFAAGGTVTSALIGGAAASVLRNGAFPRWFGWLSVVAAALMLAAVMFFPIFVLLIWMLVASVLLMRAPRAADRGGAPGERPQEREPTAAY